jgi:hypothetical protein
VTLPPDGLLAFPADLAVWLGKPPDDPKLLAALTAASRRFKGAVRHPVALVEDDTVRLSGDGTNRLLLPAAPVTAVTQVTVDGAAVTDFKVKANDGVLLRTCGPWPDWSEITVIFGHGYDPIPEDVQEAVIDQARAQYRLQPGVQSIQAGGESVTFGSTAATGVTSQWTAAVDNHRLNRGDRS